MAGLIDYAGYFPPAGLDIKTAVENYIRYLAGEKGWMLGRCIVPATELQRLDSHPGFCCSVIISSALTSEELDQLSRFNVLSTSMRQKVMGVEMVETRLPETVDSPESCLDFLLHVKSGLLQTGLQDVQLFIEAGRIASAAAVVSAIATFNNNRSGEEVVANVGYKLRCGGLEKRDFPTAEEVAEVIGICRRQDIPIKFTAGMHHPLYTYSPGLEVMQHGFINIFGAALLCWSCNLSVTQIAACLRDGNAQHFHFAEQYFSWQENIISASEMITLRQNKVIGFGSCSFTEPVAGLRSLGVLGA